MRVTKRKGPITSRGGTVACLAWLFLCLGGGSFVSAQTEDAHAVEEGLLAVLARNQHVPRGPELSAVELVMVPDEKPRRKIRADEAVEDVERFFYLLEHGYCGYGYFSRVGNFEAARDALLEDLQEREQWPTDELAERIRARLEFVHDCHLKLGNVQFAGHQDFWFAPGLELVERDGSYFVRMGDEELTVLSVNGSEPAGFLHPSLGTTGLPVYCLGLISLGEPEPLVLETKAGGRITQRRIPLERSDYKGAELFRRFQLGGLPVVRIRTFSDHHDAQIQEFLRAADELRGEPCVIIDLRHNGGGSTRWPREWIQRFTGRTPQLYQVLTELVTRTALIGQANYQAWLAAGPGRAMREQLEEQRALLLDRVRDFDEQGARPYWSVPFIPEPELIPNETTLIVVIDRAVASAGEGLISYLHEQVENVVLVGENTRGALVFGHTTAHRLPHSQLLAILPVKLNVSLDLEWREERGFEPDYWVPAEDALNRAVAAVRAGTIPTAIPLSAEVLATEFVPETPSLFSAEEIRRLVELAWVLAVPMIIAGVNHKRGPWLFLLLAAGLFVAAAVGFEQNPLARLFAFVLAWASGGVAIGKHLRRRAVPPPVSPPAS